MNFEISLLKIQNNTGDTIVPFRLNPHSHTAPRQLEREVIRLENLQSLTEQLKN